MSKIRIILVLSLVLLCSTSAFAIGSFKVFHYSDGTFTNTVGGTYDASWDCPSWDVDWAWGYTNSDFRKWFDYPECDEGGTPTVGCLAKINGVWTSVSCP